MIGGIISGIAGLAGVASNTFLGFQNQMIQSRIASENFKLQKEAQDWQREIDTRNFDFTKMQDERNFDYMRATQEHEWSRADTAHQREVEDLQRAGLSPLAASNGNVSGSIVSQNSANTMSAPNPVIPQFDGSGIANAYSDMMNANSQASAIFADAMKSIYHEKSEDRRSQARIELEADIAESNNATRLQEIREQILSNKEIENNRLKNDMLKHVDDVQTASSLLAEQVRHNKRNEILEGQRFVLDNVKSITNYGNYKFYDDVSRYNIAISEWNKLYQDFVSNNSHLLGSVSSSKSTSSSTGVGAGVGPVNANGSFSDSGSSSNSWDYSKEYYAKEKAFMLAHPYPLLK